MKVNLSVYIHGIEMIVLLLHVPVYPFLKFCYLYFELLVLKNLVFLYCLLQAFTFMTAS